MATPETRQAVILPTTTLTIAPPANSAKNASSKSQIPPSNLKIRITPSILVSTPPFAIGVTGRKVEECVDVVVYVGGKIDLGLEVDDESLAWAEGEIWAMAEAVQERVKGLFEANSATMALSNVSAPNLDHPPSLPESASSSSSGTPPGRALLRLSPLIASPSHSHLVRTLTTTGRPQVVLSRLDIKLEWVVPKPKAKHEDDEKKEEEDESQESEDVEEGAEWDADEFCDMPDDDRGGDMDLLDDSMEENKEGRAVLPKWVETQVKNGIHKVIRTHMIKRFPLLFDAALIEHASSLALHRSLISSLTHFLHISSFHSTSFLRSARHLLRSIASEQETFLNLNVTTASLIRGMPAPRTGNMRRGKKRKVEADEEQEGADLHTAKGRVEAYMIQVHSKIQEEDRGPRSDERRVGRLVGESMGRVGRGKWELGRRGIGRMAAFRVPMSFAPHSLHGDKLTVQLKDVDIAQQRSETVNNPHCPPPGSPLQEVDEGRIQDPDMLFDDWDDFDPFEDTEGDMTIPTTASLSDQEDTVHPLSSYNTNPLSPKDPGEMLLDDLDIRSDLYDDTVGATFQAGTTAPDGHSGWSDDGEAAVEGDGLELVWPDDEMTVGEGEENDGRIMLDDFDIDDFGGDTAIPEFEIDTSILPLEAVR